MVITMINFILGRSGSGKTSLVCKSAARSLERGKRVFLIVPEQMALDAESRMADLLTDEPTISLEIINFKRLCNRVFREYGGLSYNYITKSGRMLMMWKTLTELAPMLKCQSTLEGARVTRLLSAISEFKAYRITPAALDRIHERLTLEASGSDGSDTTSKGSAHLADKLYDLSLIFASYINLVGETCDDSADDLTKAAELIKANRFFEGAHVCLDSFNGYTPQELSVVDAIFRQADEVTVSLLIDPSEPSCEPFTNQASTLVSLLHLAKATSHEIKITPLNENHRAASDELRFLEKSLWSLDLTKENAFTKQSDAIRLIECQSLFAECESVATDICRRVREGAKWRDFAIMTRGINRYDGILDVILEKYGIPYFISRRTDIKSKPLIKYILCALTLLSANYKAADVISYLKTGLVGITPDEVSLLENYAEVWNIRGRRWLDDFEMNPEGYKTVFTEESARTLIRINELRERVMIPVGDFHAALNEAKTVREYCTALYSFLLDTQIPEKLTLEADRLRQSDPAAAAESEQLWSTLIDALDELCTVMPDDECDVNIFAELLGILFDEIDIGRIPSTIDEVTAGDASLVRSSAKHVYLIGANEKIFPLAPSSDSILSDSEREKLAELGAKLAGGAEYQAADERFTFYRAACSASESLTVVWSSSDLSGSTLKPSIGVNRLMMLFPNTKIIKFAELPLLDRLEGKTKLLEYIAEAKTTDPSLHLELINYATSADAGDTSLRDKLAKLDIPIIDDNAHLEAEAARLCAGNDLALTQSRLDTYVLCHFSYYCKYVLGLDEPREAKFDAASIGTFVHHVLEVFVSGANDLSKMSDEDIDKAVDEIILNYMTRICKIAPNFTGSRLAHLFARLKRSSRLLCKNIVEEFKQSKFKPAFYELPIRFPTPGEAAVEPLKIPLDDGNHAYIYGIADRVDTYEKDGKCYVRVVDYKTGSKDFSLDNIAMGLDLQMLLYLFSIWKNGSKQNSALKLKDDTEIIPAGVLYLSAAPPTITLDKRASATDIESAVQDKLARRGLLLDDEEILGAMERELSGKYLPFKINSRGTASGKDTLTSLEGFGKLLSSIEASVRSIGNEIKAGNAAAHPMKKKSQDACEYCALKPICRKCGKTEKQIKEEL